MILAEKQQKCHNYHPEKIKNMNFLRAKKSCPLIKVD